MLLKEINIITKWNLINVKMALHLLSLTTWIELSAYAKCNGGTKYRDVWASYNC